MSSNDALLRAVLLARRSEDAATLADSVLRVLLRGRRVNDALTFADDASGQRVQARLAVDYALLMDTRAVAALRVRWAPDTAVVNDSLSSASLLARAMSDATAATDNAGRALTHNRAATDDASLLDVTAAYRSLMRVLADSGLLALLDGAQARLLAARMFGDAVVLADSFVSEVTHETAVTVSTLTDSAAVQDGVLRAWQAVRQTDEPLTLADEARLARALRRDLQDAIGAADSALLRALLFRTHDDSLSLSDALLAVAARLRRYEDSVAASDAVLRAAYRAARGDDTVGLADEATALVGKFIGISDLVDVADSAQRLAKFARTGTDPIGVQDSLLRVLATLRLRDDTAALQDEVLRLVARIATLGDPISAMDEAHAALLRVSRTADPVVLDDAIERVVSALRALDDPAALTDGAIADVIRVVLKTYVLRTVYVLTGPVVSEAAPPDIEYIGTEAAATSEAETSLNVSVPTGAQAGDTLIFIVGVAGNVASVEAVYYDTSNTVNYINASFDCGLWLQAITYPVGEPASYTFEFWSLDDGDNKEFPVAAQGAAAIVVYRGLSTTAHSSSSTAESPTVATIDAPSINVTTVPAELLVAWSVDDAETVGTLSTPGDVTQLAFVAGDSGVGRAALLVGRKSLSSTGATGVKDAGYTGSLTAHIGYSESRVAP